MISKTITIPITVVGISNMYNQKPKNILQPNQANIFNNVCPAIILANKRIDKLNTRAM